MKKLYLLMFLLLIPVVSANQGHMKLLAVRESDSGYKGSIADLYLTIVPGTGRVFLETYPLLKFDTQMSTRYAKEIACDYLDLDCGNHDFFYTINADSIIIGGPSAGAAMAALTLSLLKNIDLDEGVTITGTINSGGFIGPVGGLKEKIDVALSNNLSVVAIPVGERIIKEKKEINITGTNISVEVNDTIDLVEYGKEKGIKVVEVSDLGDIIYLLTGEKKKDYGNITIDERYETTMRLLSIQLCNRSKKLQNVLSDIETDGDNATLLIRDAALNLTERGKQAYKRKEYYSSASYCFGTNVKYSHLYLILKNTTKADLLRKAQVIKGAAKVLDGKIRIKEKETITDLEAYMVVKERLIGAMNYLDKVFEEANVTKETYYNLAYASERLYSAYAWFNFFDGRGKKLELNKEMFKNSCIKKLSEAQERYQYVNSIIPISLESTERSLGYANRDLEKHDYELCLFKASKVKAEVDTLLTAMGLGYDKMDRALNQKFKLAEQIIAKQIAEGTFPVLGYSYFEYAKSLNATDKYSALLYSGYALELSNLDIYFKEKKKVYFYNFEWKLAVVFVLGVVLGFSLRDLIKKPKEGTKNPSRTSEKNALPGKKR